MTDKQEAEIDYRPTCRGIWLDRGELEKLVEQMSAMERGYARQDNQSHENQAHENQLYQSREQHSYNKHDHHYYSKRESVWHKTFDF